MPKKFAFQQARRDRRAVQLDKGSLAPRVQPVNRARQQLLAGSRFTLDQHRCIGGRNRFNIPQHMPQACAFPHLVLETMLHVQFVFEILLLLR